MRKLSVLIGLSGALCLSMMAMPAEAQVRKGGFGAAVGRPGDVGGFRPGGVGTLPVGIPGRRPGTFLPPLRGPLGINNAAFYRPSNAAFIRQQQILQARRLQAFGYGRTGLGAGYGYGGLGGGLGYGYGGVGGLGYGAAGGLGYGYGGAGGLGYVDPNAIVGGVGGIYGGVAGGTYGGGYGGMYGAPIGGTCGSASGGIYGGTYGAPVAGYSKTITVIVR